MGKKGRIHIKRHHISKRRSCWWSTSALPSPCRRFTLSSSGGCSLSCVGRQQQSCAYFSATPSVAHLCHLQRYVWKSFQRAYVKPHNFLCWWYLSFLDQYPASHPKFCRWKKRTSWFLHIFISLPVSYLSASLVKRFSSYGRFLELLQTVLILKLHIFHIPAFVLHWKPCLTSQQNSHVAEVVGGTSSYTSISQQRQQLPVFSDLSRQKKV